MRNDKQLKEAQIRTWSNFKIIIIFIIIFFLGVPYWIDVYYYKTNGHKDQERKNIENTDFIKIQIKPCTKPNKPYKIVIE